jgi:heparan-alpha-glucosaminide N-acetyltransferase
MTTTDRLISLDAFRGFVVLAMIWVNYIAEMPLLPHWLKHASATEDGFTLPDLVFPAFLFMVGVSVPLALHRHCGKVNAALLGKIAWRAGSLIVAGIVLANAYRYDETVTLLPRALYMVLFYGAMMLLWRDTQGRRPATFWIGAVLMLALLVAFRGTINAEFDRPWLQHSWWGILGMIGWTYLECSLLYLAVRGHAVALMGLFGLMIVFTMAGPAGTLGPFGTALATHFDVPGLFGSTAANVMAGCLVGRLFVRGEQTVSHADRLRFMAWFALGLVAAGFMLQPYHHINKIHATESYTLVCAGISLGLFCLFYLMIDVLAWRRWTAWLVPAGANALFAYIVPDVWEQATAVLHMPRWWWPALETGGTSGLINAAIVTLWMMVLIAGAGRIGLRLKF